MENINSQITETIKNRLLEAGKMEISIGELPKRKDLPKFFVMNLNNTALTRNDIVYMLDLIEYYGDCIFTRGPINTEGGWRYGLVFSGWLHNYINSYMYRKGAKESLKIFCTC